MTAKRVYLCAGEPSGDLHGASLVRALRELESDWQFVGLGGREMQAAGVELRHNLVDHAVMGFTRVVAQFGTVIDVAAQFLEEIRSSPPDFVVLIDYPGLNLNLARMARDAGIPVVYYICPQVWAWAPWRMRRIVRSADALLVILPFEERLYGERHPQVTYVGNPVFDHLSAIEAAHPDVPRDSRRLALFPGSRRQEVEGALPMMLRVAEGVLEHYPDIEVCVSCQRPKLEPAVAQAMKRSNIEPQLWRENPHELQRSAHLSLVVSGTATLEHAYFGTPMVVMYPTTQTQRELFAYLSVTPFIALVNLFAGQRVVPEFLFSDGDCDEITAQALELMEGAAREDLCKDLKRLRADRFVPGAAERAAREIVSLSRSTA